MNTKIAIFNWGEISIHAYYLAKLLTKNGISIDLFLYTPRHTYKKSYLQNLIIDLKNKNINIIEIKCTFLEAKLLKLNRITRLFGRQLPAIFTNLILPSKTRKLFDSKNYKYVIAISHFSLYWVYSTEQTILKKTIYYSLEIFKVTDPYIKKHSAIYAIINMETKLLNFVRGLIIQDLLRAQALLNNKVFRDNLEIIYLPVSIPGNNIQSKSDYLHQKFDLGPDQKIILYFGAEYKERKLDELISTFEKITNNKLTLIIHGTGNPRHNIKSPNIKISNTFLGYDNLHLIISSATIGIALYDNSWPNTRLTAFSSEKIAHYLQAGVPFIAFKNESYLNLKNEFNCCELIEDICELNDAINSITGNYESYRLNCFKGYKKYYNIEYTIKPLTQFLIT